MGHLGINTAHPASHAHLCPPHAQLVKLCLVKTNFQLIKMLMRPSKTPQKCDLTQSSGLKQSRIRGNNRKGNVLPKSGLGQEILVKQTP